jgi:DNA-binding MarR family transcriptional regulator
VLSDIERKVLRIIANFSVGRRRTPTVDELCVKTGRDRGGIMAVLETLAREEYIEWSRSEPDKMTVLEAWERKDDVRWHVR